MKDWADCCIFFNYCFLKWTLFGRTQVNIWYRFTTKHNPISEKAAVQFDTKVSLLVFYRLRLRLPYAQFNWPENKNLPIIKVYKKSKVHHLLFRSCISEKKSKISDQILTGPTRAKSSDKYFK